MTTPYNKIIATDLPNSSLQLCESLEESYYKQVNKVYSAFEISGISYATLFGINSESVHSPKYYGLDLDSVGWTDISNTFLELKTWVEENFGTDFYRIRIQKISPGGFITPHMSDPYINEEVLYGVVNWSESADLYCTDHGRIPLIAGETWSINNSYEVGLRNNSAETLYLIEMGQSKYWNDIANSYYNQ